ncbi:hypothetical protein C0Q70_06451 [Pomacea canaliculata]|uniref:AIG1-type G domain-containing protein n=1 Tax=Pomacea canaliculata TaxID=400727 RepID=A0A2T7PP34_POMCA|nr:hypothetical protein C0Q70_06451 [Pomacea canaliculata]
MLDESTGKSEIELDNLGFLKMKTEENSFKKSQRSSVEQGLAPQPAELYRREQENFAGLSNKEEMMQAVTMAKRKVDFENRIFQSQWEADYMFTNISGRPVMDSTGLFDISKTHEEVAIEVVQAVACMHLGPTAILYVISLANRYTPEENGVYERLKSLLNKQSTEYMIVIFTRGNELNQNRKTIQDFLSTARPELRKVLEECSGRFVVFENFADDKDSQVDRLLLMVRTLSEAHGGQPYMCSKFIEVDEKMTRRLRRG